MNNYNIARAIQHAANSGGFSTAANGLTGDERLAHEAITRTSENPANGFFVPWSAFSNRSDLVAGTSNLGGATIQTDVKGFVEILRPATFAARAGVEFLTGLRGSVQVPRQTAKILTEHLGENTAATASNMTFGQLNLVPHRLAARTAFTRQLLAQSSLDIQATVIKDIMQTIGREFDRVLLHGTGADNEPMGIFATPGVGTVTFGGAATYAKLVDFETQVSAANADSPACCYVTSTNCRSKWKLAPKIGTTFPTFVWEKANWGDGSPDGEVNSRRAIATNLVADDKVCFGDFSKATIGVWGSGIDLCVDPITQAGNGLVIVTANVYYDAALKQPTAFCISTDTGAA